MNDRMLVAKAAFVFFAASVGVTDAFGFFLPRQHHRQSSAPLSSLYYANPSVVSDDADTAISLDPLTTGFVFIEFQNEFTTPGGKLHDAVKDCMQETNMLENSVQVASMARQAGARILHCPISFQPGHEEISNSPYGILKDVKGGACFTAGTWGADICSAMMPHSGDLVVKGKSGLCGFESTNLEFLLRQHGIQTIVLAGFLTNCCVESTMRTAYEKGFKVYTLKDCTAATSIEAHQSTLEHNFGMFSIPTTSGNIISALKR